jgi:hypothetical protein
MPRRIRPLRAQGFIFPQPKDRIPLKNLWITTVKGGNSGKIYLGRATLSLARRIVRIPRSGNVGHPFTLSQAFASLYADIATSKTALKKGYCVSQQPDRL